MIQQLRLTKKFHPPQSRGGVGRNKVATAFRPTPIAERYIFLGSNRLKKFAGKKNLIEIQLSGIFSELINLLYFIKRNEHNFFRFLSVFPIDFYIYIIVQPFEEIFLSVFSIK